MNSTIKFVGLDVSKATIAVAVADKNGSTPRYLSSERAPCLEWLQICRKTWSLPCGVIVSSIFQLRLVTWRVNYKSLHRHIHQIGWQQHS